MKIAQPEDYKQTVIHALNRAKNNTTTRCVGFNWYYKPYTDALHKLVTNCYIGRVKTGIFDYNGSLYTSSGDLLIYLGEK